MLLNSVVGMNFWKRVEGDFEYKDSKLEYAVAGNHNLKHPTERKMKFGIISMMVLTAWM